MAKIIFEKQCGCFKRSGKEVIIEMDNIEDAKKEAQDIVDDINNNWCGKHNFDFTVNGDDINITMESN